MKKHWDGKTPRNAQQLIEKVLRWMAEHGTDSTHFAWLAWDKYTVVFEITNDRPELQARFYARLAGRGRIVSCKAHRDFAQYWVEWDNEMKD